MTMDALALFTAFKSLAAKSEDKIPEPEFKRFRFPKKEAAPARARAITPANVTREPRTLEELGVPEGLAHDLEATMRAMGFAKGNQVVGFTFTRPDGSNHALRFSGAPGRDAADKAA